MESDLKLLLDAKKSLAAVLARTGARKATKTMTAEERTAKAERKARFQAKQAELREGGKEADAKDWVRRYGTPQGIASITVLEDAPQVIVRAQPVDPLPRLDPCDCPELLELLLNPPSGPTQGFGAPTRTDDRTVRELYRMLTEKWDRYAKVVANKATDAKPKPVGGWDPSAAWVNVESIVTRLQRKGESMQQIVSFLQQDGRR